MRIRMATALLAGALLSQSAVRADDPAPVATSLPSTTVYTQNTQNYSNPFQDVCGPAGRCWVKADYLLWWTKGDRLPALVTTSPAGTSLFDAGILDVAGTRVLFGDSRVNDDAQSGWRVTVGTWLNHEQTFGVEANYFSLGRQTTNFSASSEDHGILARPFFDVGENRQNSLLLAFPGLVKGDIHVSATSRLEGFEFNLRQNLCCGCNYRIDLLAGYRYLSLRDSLHIQETEINVGIPDLPIGTRFDLNDNFDTRNRFNGGQIGLDAEYRSGCWFVGATGKVALGSTRQGVTINGNTDGEVPGGTRVSNPGGLLALPTNIGNHSRSEFSVVPEFGLNAGMQVGEHVRFGVGYSILYWTHVARAGEQIDTNVNTSQLPPGSLVGEGRPTFNFHNSDYWAQGVNFFLEFRY